jgi:hypothetical protein
VQARCDEAERVLQAALARVGCSTTLQECETLLRQLVERHLLAGVAAIAQLLQLPPPAHSKQRTSVPRRLQARGKGAHGSLEEQLATVSSRAVLLDTQPSMWRGSGQNLAASVRAYTPLQPEQP